ncbi:hypothetical protein [Niveispirillum irakense]|uniref:hypothetical protein n=1 Tax=Niveispirillum irakense TaxID=34011 RepID=UPI000411C730|nr:hypothetical protein [Niveispirillum irakense]
MLEKLVEAAIVFAIIGGLSYLVGMAISHSMESALRRRLEGEGLDGRLMRLNLLAQRFQARKDSMLPRLVKLDAQVKSARRRQYMITKKLNDLKIARSRLMRVLGEEDAFLRPERPARKFIAEVVNRHVQRTLFEHKEHPFLSRAWSRTQQVVIWAPTIGDAKAMAEKSYPPATGFFIAGITEPQSDAEEELSALEEASLKAAEAGHSTP